MLWLQSATRISEEEIRRATDAAFRSRALNSDTLWSRFTAWLGELWSRFWRFVWETGSALHVSKPVAIGIVILLGLALATLLARAIYVWRRSGGIRRPAAWFPTATRGAPDPRAAAHALAAGGDYTAAAHALYGALLDAAARGQQLRLHPSKTAGDYARELRARRSDLFARFLDFAGLYEVVIYGHGRCDQERYERLSAIAVPIFRAHG